MLHQTANELCVPTSFHDLGSTAAIPTALLLCFPQPLTYQLLLQSNFLGACEKLRYVCLSVRPHGTSRPPPHGRSLNFIFEY